MPGSKMDGQDLLSESLFSHLNSIHYLSQNLNNSSPPCRRSLPKLDQQASHVLRKLGEGGNLIPSMNLQGADANSIDPHTSTAQGWVLEHEPPSILKQNSLPILPQYLPPLQGKGGVVSSPDGKNKCLRPSRSHSLFEESCSTVNDTGKGHPAKNHNEFVPLNSFTKQLPPSPKFMRMMRKSYTKMAPI